MLRKLLFASTCLLPLAIGPAVAEEIELDLAGLPFASDTEFFANWANNVVNADDAHRRGWTGAGQTVSVFDTGIDGRHPEFAGRLIAGYDAVRGQTGLNRDVAWPGTFVAGIIGAARDGVGMQGIAYDVNLLPIRIANRNGSITLSDANLAAGINYARGRAGIQNHSWNSSATILDVTQAQFAASYGQSITAWLNSVNLDNNVVVWAAGNEGKAQVGVFGALPAWYTDLLKGWIVTVAIDQNGSIAGYSNRCGVAANWCITAPGTNAFSTYPGGGYATSSGTSFAAPVVAGGAALLKQLWPFLPNSDIVSILFTTANKSGIYANASIYGQGLLDLNAATQPVGTTGIATGSTVETTVATSSTITATSAAFGTSLGSLGVTGGANLMILDSYKRDFHVPVGTFVAPAIVPYDMERNIRQVGGALIEVEDASGIAYAVSADEGLSLHGLPRFAMNLPVGEGERVTLTTGLNPVHLFGGTAAGLDSAGLLARGDVIGSAYLGLGGTESWGGAYSARLSSATTIAVAAMHGNQADAPTEWQVDLDPFRQISRADVTGVAARGEALVAGARLALQTGYVREAATVLGSASEGALSLGSSAGTAFAGVSFEMELPLGISAFGGAELGVTEVEAAPGSLVTGLSGLTTSAFHLGITSSGLFGDSDRLGLVVSQPLRVEAGRAHLNLPVARDLVGNVLYDADARSLVPDGREIDVQLGYSTALGEDSSLALSSLLRLQPDNVRTAPAEGVFMARYRVRL